MFLLLFNLLIESMDLIIDHTSKRSAEILKLDEKLSRRDISLDPRGYFLIRVDLLAAEIVVEHFTNDLDQQGRAIDPETGEVLGCQGGASREPHQVFRGRSAKELGVQLTEGENPCPLTRLDHALYLGRELQKAEESLLTGTSYVQD